MPVVDAQRLIDDGGEWLCTVAPTRGWPAAR